MFSKDLEFTIGQCYKRAREARDEYMTVEHLLLALLENPSAESVLKASGTDFVRLRADLEQAILTSVTKLADPAPTMRQHVSSWFGGAGFLAVRGEPGWVAKLPVQRWDPGQRLERPGAAGEYDCHTDGDLPEAAISTLFQMGLTSRPQRVLPYGDAAALPG